jgi:hypothetical protein
LVPLYKQAYEIMHDSPAELQQNLQMAIVLQQGEDRRRYNLPTVDEVAAIIPGTGEEDVDCNRDIVLRYKHGGLRNITYLHPLYAPLHYVLLFPNGDQGWHKQIESGCWTCSSSFTAANLPAISRQVPDLKR